MLNCFSSASGWIHVATYLITTTATYHGIYIGSTNLFISIVSTLFSDVIKHDFNVVCCNSFNFTGHCSHVLTFPIVTVSQKSCVKYWHFIMSFHFILLVPSKLFLFLSAHNSLHQLLITCVYINIKCLHKNIQI